MQSYRLSAMKQEQKMARKKAERKADWWRRQKGVELKFRIWDVKKKMFVVNTFQKALILSSIVFGLNKDEISEGQFILQQYTGCKDINGNDIYEGDILKTNEWGFEAAVVFRKAYFSLEDSRGGFCCFPSWSNCEIIGDIFHNPELC